MREKDEEETACNDFEGIEMVLIGLSYNSKLF